MATPIWWDYEITSSDECQLGFQKGSLVFARNGEDNITLFDGRKWANLPKMAVTRIKLQSRLSEREAAFVEQYYQFKLRQASHSSIAKASDMREAQEAHMPNIIMISFSKK